MFPYAQRPAPSAPLVLYDAPAHSGHSQGSIAWLPNSWRVRFILNYKRLHYHTIWINIEDAQNMMRELGAPPSTTRSNGSPVYALPMIVDNTMNPRVVVTNPQRIAEYLESRYPLPPIFPHGSRTQQTLFVHYVQETFVDPLLNLLVPLSYSRHLSHQAQAYLRNGVPMQPMSPDQRSHLWGTVEGQFNLMARHLDDNARDPGGIMGNGITYAEFTLCSLLVWIRATVSHEEWATVRSWSGGRWNELWKKCTPYMAVL